MSEEKLIDFLEKFSKLLYDEAKPYREKLGMTTNSTDYEWFKKSMMKEPLALFKMIRNRINNDHEIAALIYLTNPQFFKTYRIRKEIERNKDFLLTYFNISSKELRSTIRRLENILEKDIGDWFEKIYSQKY